MDRQLPEDRFDPFLCDRLVLKHFEDTAPLRTLWAIPAVLMVLIVVNLIQGTLGHSSSIGNAFVDAGYALHMTAREPVLGSYDFGRDIVSWIVFGVIAATLFLVHSQWLRMKAVVPELVQTEAFPDSPALRRNVREVNLRLCRLGTRYKYLIVGAALAATGFTVWGLRRVGVFSVLAPRGAPADVRARFAESAYQSWWAGLEHPIGFVFYVSLAALGIYLIAVQVLVGFNLARFLKKLRKENAKFGIDSYNADGVAGWSSAGRVLTSVFLSLFVHGFGLAVVIFVVGREGIAFILFLIALWFVVTPVFAWFPLRRISKVMKEARRWVIDSYIQRSEHLPRPKTMEEALDREASTRAGVAQILAIRTVPLSRTYVLLGAVLTQIVPILALAIEVWISTRN